QGTESADATPPEKAGGIELARRDAVLSRPTERATDSKTSVPVESLAARLVHLLPVIWLTGSTLFSFRLLLAAVVLQRRLSACRPVNDPTMLELLDRTRQTLGLKRTPALLVSPESMSPCVAGTWCLRIIVPESLITEGSTARLRHVLAHELAHLV